MRKLLRPPILIAIASTLLSLSIGLVAVEIYLRAVRPLDPYLTFHSKLGWNSVPAITKFGATDAGELPRVVVLGDSYTQRALWPQMIYDEISSRGSEFAGYTLGVAGFGTHQALLKLERHIAALKPTQVVLLMYLWNDLRDNVLYPGIIYGSGSRWRPYADPERCGNSSPVPSTYPPPIFRALRSLARIRTYDLVFLPLERRILAVFSAVAGSDRIAARRFPVLLSELDREGWLPFYLRSRSKGPYVKAAWHATECALLNMKKLTAEHGAELVVAALDNAFTVDPDVFELQLSGIESDRGLDISLPLSSLGEITSRHGIRFVNLRPALVKRQRDSNHKLHIGPPGNLSGHLTKEGQQVIAGELAPVVAQRVAAAEKIVIADSEEVG